MNPVNSMKTLHFPVAEIALALVILLILISGAKADDLQVTVPRSPVTFTLPHTKLSNVVTPGTVAVGITVETRRISQLFRKLSHKKAGRK